MQHFKLLPKTMGCSLWLRTLMLIAALGHAQAYAQQSGKTSQGWPYVVGGVSEEERQDMKASTTSHNLWVITAAAGSGAYLADVEIILRNSKGIIQHQQKLEGPWYLLQVPPGRYILEAHYRGERIQRRLHVISKQHQRIHLHFKCTGHGTSPKGC